MQQNRFVKYRVHEIDNVRAEERKNELVENITRLRPD